MNRMSINIAKHLVCIRFETRRRAMAEVINWLTYYNHRRRHSKLGYISPMKFEQNWFAAQLNDAA